MHLGQQLARLRYRARMTGHASEPYVSLACLACWIELRFLHFACEGCHHSKALDSH